MSSTDNISVFGGLRAAQRLGRCLCDARTPRGPTFSYLLDDAQSDTGYGYMLGAAYEIPDIALRVALTYFSEIDVDFDAREASRWPRLPQRTVQLAAGPDPTSASPCRTPSCSKRNPASPRARLFSGRSVGSTGANSPSRRTCTPLRVAGLVATWPSSMATPSPTRSARASAERQLGRASGLGAVTRTAMAASSATSARPTGARRCPSVRATPMGRS